MQRFDDRQYGGATHLAWPRSSHWPIRQHRTQATPTGDILSADYWAITGDIETLLATCALRRMLFGQINLSSERYDAMKLCRYDADRFGVVRGDHVHDVTATIRQLGPFHYPLPMGDPMMERLDELRPEIEQAADTGEQLPLARVMLRSPVANPSKIVCAPVNYLAHEAEGMADPAIHFDRHQAKIREVALFLKARSALAGPGEGIALRNLDRRNDHELELVAVIGAVADRVAVEHALDHVAGYTIGLDITTRGPEDRSFRKSPDSYALVGPWLVTADEITDSGSLDLRLSVNGDLRQQANTRDLVVSLPELIAWASHCYTLLPGDLLFTGTPSGVGPIVPGDTIVAEISGLGCMETVVRIFD